MHFDLHPSTNAKERNTSYLIRTVSFVLTVLYVLHKIILGEGSQGSNSQSWGVFLWGLRDVCWISTGERFNKMKMELSSRNS